MKVYFSVMGIGLGHITRCLAITKHLQKYDIDFVFSSYGKASDIAAKEGFKSYKSKSLMWNQTKTGEVDFETTFLRSSITFKQMASHFKDERIRIKKEKPDLIVSDSRYSIIPASKVAKAPRIYITNQPTVVLPEPRKINKNIISPLQKISNWFNYHVLSGQDKILLPDFPQPYSISTNHMIFDKAPEKFKKKIEFVGPIASNRPEHTTEKKVKEICTKYNVEPGKFIYIAFSGPGRIKNEIHNVIFDLFSDYKTPAIMGSGSTGDFKIHEKGNLKLVDGWIKERAELLAGCNLVISRAGLSTLSEMVAFGKKTIVIPQANQPEQESNALGIENLGIGKKLKSNHITKKILKENIDFLQSSEPDVKKIKDLAKKMNGEKKSAEIILNYLEKKGSLKTH
jgi:UDP-N-acetylglucosamine--N-acetylmuramyl-(pentapeptide) pyrophosphoryl-undecaprenol N-acetylglucosamine transferase